MSFSEIAYPHQVLVVDLAGEAVGAVREVRIPRTVELLRVPERPAPLTEVLSQLAALALPERPEAEWPYLLVRVQLTQPEPGLRAEIEAALEGKPVRLARIETRYGNQGGPESAPLLSVDELNALAPSDFFQRLYQHRFGEAAPAQLMAAFTELLNATPEAP
jgi:exonuclease SbcD